MAKLIQRVKWTNDIYDAGDTQANYGAYVQPIPMHATFPGVGTMGAYTPSATVTTTSITYQRISQDIYLAEVDEPFGKVRRIES